MQTSTRANSRPRYPQDAKTAAIASWVPSPGEASARSCGKLTDQDRKSLAGSAQRDANSSNPTANDTPSAASSNPARQSHTSAFTSDRSKHERKSGILDMAHCQLKGPLLGPLRERRRTDIAGEHPVWKATRQYQADLMTLMQQIRRTPGIPAKLAETLCETLTTQSQQINNAIRETVDDASEIRIQIDEANHALMTLKVQETAAEHDLGQMEKQIKEQREKAEETEERLAKYHNDAEKDRNAIREHLAQLKDADNEEAKQELTKQLLETLHEQLSVSHTIWSEPVKKPTEYETALAAVKEANPGFIPETSPVINKANFEMNPFDAGVYDPPRRSTSFGSPPAPPARGGFRGLMQQERNGNKAELGSSFQSNRTHGFTDSSNDVFRPVTPRDRSSFTSPQGGFSGGFGPMGSFSKGSANSKMAMGDFSRPGTSMGHRNNGGYPPALHSLRAKASEFLPGDAEAFNSQLASMNLGQGRGFVNGHNQGSFAGSRPMSRATDNQAVVPFVSNDARVGAGPGGPGFYGNGPSRPQYGPNQYDHRLVVARSQPSIPLGQMYGGMTDDLGRFRVSFHELFSMARSFVATWIGEDAGHIDRSAPIMQYLPKCYTGFTEHQAWSYVRQHLLDSLSRSCLFARVIVDFICERILVPSAWQGFDFQSDRRIQQLEAEKARGPIITGGGRTAYGSAISEVVTSIVNNERYETYRETRINYFAMELENMLGPLMSQYANLEEAHRDLGAMVGKAWSLSAKTLTSRLAFEYRFPDAGCRFSLQSMIAVAPNIDGYILQAEHWRVQLVVTPVITVRNDNGNTLSVDVANLAEVLLMK